MHHADRIAHAQWAATAAQARVTRQAQTRRERRALAEPSPLVRVALAAGYTFVGALALVAFVLAAAQP